MKLFLKLFIGLLLISSSVGVVYFGTADFRNQDNLMNRLQCLYSDKNTIEIKEGLHDVNDFEIRLYSGNVIFQSGQQNTSIPRRYGGVDFLIYYKSILIGQAGIQNRNWWQTHDFIFDFTSQETERFTFKAKGPDFETMYYKHILLDSFNGIQTEFFYDHSGFTGQINKKYFNPSTTLIADEIWVYDTLISLTIYHANSLIKNYSTRKYEKDVEYKINKPDTVGYLIYDLTIYRKDSLSKEKIIVKY
jgi:hypothetical protein